MMGADRGCLERDRRLAFVQAGVTRTMAYVDRRGDEMTSLFEKGESTRTRAEGCSRDSEASEREVPKTVEFRGIKGSWPLERREAMLVEKKAAETGQRSLRVEEVAQRRLSLTRHRYIDRYFT
jgi:hypothetical protein